MNEEYYVVTNDDGNGIYFYSRMKRIESQTDCPLQIVESKYDIKGYKRAFQLFDDESGGVVKIDYFGKEWMTSAEITIISENKSQRDAALTRIESLSGIKPLTAIVIKE